MSLLRTRAIVLRRIAYGDSSWIVHAFTEREGAMSVMAKGARRPRSPLGASLEPLALAELVVSLKSGRDLQTLTQASLLDPREGMRSDLVRMAYGLAVAEAVHRFVQQPLEHAALFGLLARTLEAFDRDPAPPVPSDLWAYLARLAAELGVEFAVDHCAACGSLEIPSAPVASVAAGGFLCAACGAGASRDPLPAAWADAVRRAARGPTVAGEDGPENDSAGESLSQVDPSGGIAFGAGLSGMNPAGGPLRDEPPEDQVRALDELWYSHLIRHLHLHPRLDARHFLDDIRHPRAGL